MKVQNRKKQNRRVERKNGLLGKLRHRTSVRRNNFRGYIAETLDYLVDNPFSCSLDTVRKYRRRENAVEVWEGVQDENN